MSWIVFALIAPALYTCVAFTDKYLLSSQVKDYNAMPIYMGIVASIMGCLFFIASGYPLLHTVDTLIILSTGILTTIGLVFYFKALSLEEASIVNIFFQTLPVISLVMGFIFLGEKISLIQSLGFILILSSSIGLAIKQTNNTIRFSPALILIFLQNILWATSGILMKYSLGTNKFIDVLSYESFGIGIGALLLFLFGKKFRRGFLITSKNLTDKARAIIFINEGLGVFAKACTFFAFTLGPVGLVSVVEGTQGIFGIIYGMILTPIFPTIFKENLEMKVLARKLFFALLTIVGVTLLS